MGRVFRARDTKLKREVALKVLPEDFIDDADRISRFQREAEALASLSHGNIAQIYGLEESGSTRCIVMELVEGETLAERIHRGPIPAQEAVDIARQIAEALEAAHEKGIMHRDLKPANIKVEPDGKVKVLDFGLAKVVESSPLGGGTADSPTVMTRSLPGVIMGTAAYMAPEQAKGKPIDKRADIWAFGVVFVEMLTGTALYSGETVSEILAAVMMKEPSLAALPGDLPRVLRRLIERCLDKDPKRRLRDIGEARLVLSEPSKNVHSSVSPKPEVTVALSPNGSLLAFSVSEDGVDRLYLRKRNESESRRIPGTEGASQPVFSPDGRSLAFFAGGMLKKITLDGTATELAPAPEPRGLTWLDANTIVYTQDATGGLSAISMAHYASTGHLVFGRGGSLYAVSFDPTRLTVSEPPETTG